MRTTITIDDRLLDEVPKRAAALLDLTDADR